MTARTTRVNGFKLDALRAINAMPAPIHSSILSRAEAGKRYRLSNQGPNVVKTVGEHVSTILRAGSGGLDDIEGLEVSTKYSSLTMTPACTQTYAQVCKSLTQIEEKNGKPTY